MQTTLCYLTVGNKTLMIHRNKKKEDANKGKWIGIGGKFEHGESPEECMLREFREETGLTLTAWRYRGIVTFVSGEWVEYMHLFTATQCEGELMLCDEGTLQWVDKELVPSLPTWEGDRVFLRLLREREAFFSLKLEYDLDERLCSVMLDGVKQEQKLQGQWV